MSIHKRGRFWIEDPPCGKFAFARAVGQKPVSPQATRAYLRSRLKKAGIDQKISSHPLRHTNATNLLNAGAERMNLQARLGHKSFATTPLDARVGPERMAAVVVVR